MGFNIVLYSSILFSNDSCEFLPNNQYILLSLNIKYLHICFFLSKCRDTWRLWLGVFGLASLESEFHLNRQKIGVRVVNVA